MLAQFLRSWRKYSKLILGTGAWQAAPGLLLAALASAPGYKGAWNASSGAMPAEPAVGDMWLCSAGGEVGGVAYLAGDLILYTGAAWLRRPFAFPSIFPGAAQSLDNGLSGGTADTLAWDVGNGCWHTDNGVNRALHADYDINGHDLSQLFDGNGETIASYAGMLINGSGTLFSWNYSSGCWDTGAYGVDYAVQALTANSAIVCGSADSAISLSNMGNSIYWSDEQGRWDAGNGVNLAFQATIANGLDNMFGNYFQWDGENGRWTTADALFCSGAIMTTTALYSAGESYTIGYSANGVYNQTADFQMLDVNGASRLTKGFDGSIQQTVAATATLSQVIAALKTAGLFIDPV